MRNQITQEDNNYIRKKNRTTIKYALIIILTIFSSCREFLNIDLPKTVLSSKAVFTNDDSATAALTNIYARMGNGLSYVSGGRESLSLLAGLSSDEFINYSPALIEFYENQIDPINVTLRGLYSVPYNNIFGANSVLEGLLTSEKITPAIKSQLQGEAYFIRAFAYFYLVNFFGPVPLQLTTDYRITRVLNRASQEEIYQQIIDDLKNAEILLSETYPSAGRVRPNRAVAQALLSRVYLYMEDWKNAEKYSSMVISRSSTYSLSSLDNIFLASSSEAIWQLFPAPNSNIDQNGNLLVLTATPTLVALREAFVLNAFEANDKRKTSWIKSYTNTTGTYYYPFKYKLKGSTSVTEYSLLFRLTEQFLIRAEARAQQDNIGDAIDDLDKIRNRAGLKLIKTSNPNINKTDLLESIQKERRVELFCEYGHRWFDLKRTGKANLVLAPLKLQWQETDVLYPIPYDETSRNPNVKQNEGY